MAQTWIVLCTASRARICEWADGQGRLREVADLVHPQSRMKGIDLREDSPGHVQRSAGDTATGRTALDPRTDPHRKEHQKFAKELAQYLDEAMKTKRCSGFALVAANPFLGELKSQLKPACYDAILTVLARDLTSLGLPDLESHFAALRSPLV